MNIFAQDVLEEIVDWCDEVAPFVREPDLVRDLGVLRSDAYRLLHATWEGDRGERNLVPPIRYV